jgi:vancomycin permeability regulator SanA
MKVSEIKYEDLSNDIINKILFEGIVDNGEKACCAMVLGSNKAHRYRVPVAAMLYIQKRVTKLLLCGGNIMITENGDYTEAEIMRQKAIELGVLSCDILKEEISLTTKENMICGLLPLEREFKLSAIDKIILVTTTYHMRRSLLMARTYFPDWITILPCPVDDINTKKDNWWLSESGYKRAKEEAWKIICYINEKTIPDFEIIY